MPYPIHCGKCNTPLFFRLAYRNVGLTVSPHDLVLGSDRGPKPEFKSVCSPVCPCPRFKVSVDRCRPEMDGQACPKSARVRVRGFPIILCLTMFHVHDYLSIT